MSTLSSLIGAELPQFCNYWQENDPGAVGYKKTWFKETTRELKFRNPTNTGWLPILVPTNALSLPSGSDWGDVVGAYDDASPGDSIYWPNETIVQTSNLWVTKNIRFIASGPSSKLITGAGIVSGSQFTIGENATGGTNTITDFEWSGIAIEHDRAITERSYVWQLTGGISNIRIHDASFENITHDVFLVLNQSGDSNAWTENLYFERNAVTECWESVFNVHAGNCRNAYFLKNICNVSNGNPNMSISRPYGAILQNEEEAFPSIGENIHISGNQFISTLTGGDFTDSVGFRTHYENDGFRWHRTYVNNNLFDGWHKAISYGAYRAVLTGRSHHYCSGNTVQNSGSASIPMIYISTILDADNYVVCGDNDLIKITGAQTPVELAAASAQIIQSPPNRVT